MKCLIVILGPTGVGKTNLSLQIANHFNSPILSADSRQMYRGIEVGTAAPTADMLSRVKHHFIGNLNLTEYYSAGIYEEEFLKLASTLFAHRDTLIMCGGSMMYIDAVCKGIDKIPTITPEIRAEVMRDYAENGLEALCNELKVLDPELYSTIDLQNHKRVMHAIEVCRQCGEPYSLLRKNSIKERDFKIIKIGLNRERAELFERINSRTEIMINDGFIDEAKSVYHLRHLNSLNTVGFKELFTYFDGDYTLDEAKEKIKRNTRVYAKKQLTWFKRDETIKWFHPDDVREVFEYIEGEINRI